MKVLIIGLGSIANKHIGFLREIVTDVKIYALRSGFNAIKMDGICHLYSYDEITFQPDFILVSNPTSEHYQTLKKVSEFNCPIFIEKPALDNLHNSEELASVFDKKKIISYVGFNLRFLPCLSFLKDNISAKKRINEVNVYCGSYLPDWRKGIDFRKNYSANIEMGGGVHLDLIHELDYIYWIFGQPEKVQTKKRNKSSLNITSSDYANYYLEFKEFSINVVLNYFRRDEKRTCEIVFEDETWTVDLLKNQITSSKDGEIFVSQINKLNTYQLQMEYFLNCISKKEQTMNTFQNSLDVLKICLNENT